ncbi:MAG TPA: Mov34/MPN/PAD-1 family protein [Gemmatimonadales bacterium]|nr:Mov34/MPN/PAD-1 family protein [Gemmatimonadales bacterium]
MARAARGSRVGHRPPTLWLARDAHAAMLREAVQRHPHETGGVLLGYAGDGDDVVVTAVVGPGPNAVHERSRFVPDHAHHESEVARLYEQSGRRWTYLGDWHTHPDTMAYLSATDAETLESIAGAEAARVPWPVMVILGQHPGAPVGRERPRRLAGEHWYVRAWRYARRRALLGRITRGRPTDADARRCEVALFNAPA